MRSTEPKAVAVAAGCLINPRGEVLICQRPLGKIAAGKWEFPGGKIEPGESARSALIRELREELGVEVRSARPLIRVVHDYSDRRVLLEVWRVLQYSGELHPHDGQAFAWVPPGELDSWELLAADWPVVSALQLPNDYVFTPVNIAGPMLSAGLKSLPHGSLLRLRCPQLTDSEYELTARKLVADASPLGLQVILDRAPAMAEAVGAAGWHASAANLQTLRQRPLPQALWFAASCHDKEEILRARDLGADFCVAGPVQVTATHPEGLPLGWERLRALAHAFNRPLYAIGGLGPQNHADAWAAGAQGVAGIRAYWSFDSSVASGGV